MVFDVYEVSIELVFKLYDEKMFHKNVQLTPQLFAEPKSMLMSNRHSSGIWALYLESSGVLKTRNLPA